MTAIAFPNESTTLLLPGPAGALEVAVDLPEPADARPLVAVVCHPLPTEGGTMHNKVVTMVARALRELGATTVRFNFRGTGDSEGEFDHGVGEREDLRAVVEWVRATHPGHALWLAGFSFGSFVTLSSAAELQPDALVSIAPPRPAAAGNSPASRCRRCRGWWCRATRTRSSIRRRCTTGSIRWSASRSWCACPRPATSSTAS
ncbi:alpha/beta hydrolase [Pseudoxanthomonas suwonensis]